MRGLMRGGRRRDDAGQVVSALVIVVALGLVLVAVRVLLPVARSADLSQRAQAAADAAALAGADQLVDDLRRHWTTPFLDPDDVTRWMACGSGSGRARTYAARNDARLVAYCYVLGTDRIQVRVEGRTSIEGSRPRAEATAELGVQWSACRWQPHPTDPRIERWTCPGLEVPFRIDPATKKRVAAVPPGWWNNRFVPRLVAS